MKREGSPRTSSGEDVTEDYFTDPTDEEFAADLAEAQAADVLFPENPSEDFRTPNEEVENEPTPNPNILELVQAWLRSGNAPEVVQAHISLHLMVEGTIIADYRNLVDTVHWYAPGVPYRYIIHPTLLGASGHGKGATVASFFRLHDATEDEPQLCPLYEYQGGSLEAFRGAGPNLEVPNRREMPPAVRRGAIERNHMGFIHIPEFTQLPDISSRGGGTLQTILAWADTGKLSYETVSYGHVKAFALARLIVGLQSGKLSETESAVLGWNRRTVYDLMFPPTVEQMLPPETEEEEPREGDKALFREARAAIARAYQEWHPESIDWRPFRGWLKALYETLQLTTQDEQMLYSLAIGEHLMAGRAWTGHIVIRPPKWMLENFQRLLWHKLEGRIDPDRRLAVHSLYVLMDPMVLGTKGDRLPRAKLERVVAARLSVPEEHIRRALARLTQEHLLDMEEGEYTLADMEKVQKFLAGRN